MTALEQQIAVILSAAASAPHGVCVQTNDPARARLAFYKVRRDLADSEHQLLQIRVSPDSADGELWIIRPPTVTISYADSATLL